MQRLRVGLVGAGLVGQAEHAFYLWEDRGRFDLAGLADPSPSVRAAVGDRYGVPLRCASIEELAASDVDAIVCAAPDPFHPQIVEAALTHGLHVLCEKPLALTVEACEALDRHARDRGLVLQVAYMKRYDPAYRRALELLPEHVEDVRWISVEVNDPDFAPFVDHLPMTWPDDVPAELRDELRARRREQLHEAAGRELDEAGERALGGGFLSSLVHDVSVVHGLLAALGGELPVEAGAGAFFDEGRGVQLAFGLPGGGRVSMTHLNLPGVPDYRERVTVYCRDRIVELTFPSPYLRHEPTRLVIKRSGGGHALETTAIRAGYEESFRNELRAFHAAVTEGAPVETPAGQAARDIALLVDAFHRAVT